MMSGWLNRRFAKLALKTLKWFALACAALSLASVAAALLGRPLLNLVLSPRGGVQLLDGQAVYDDRHTPTSEEQERENPPASLIWENQLRYRRHQAELERRAPVGPLDDLDPAPAQERDSIWRTASALVQAWDSFSVGESEASYRSRISPYVRGGALDSIADRIDNLQNQAIDREGESGSAVMPASLRPGSMHVLRYSSSSAYVSLRARVLYTGPSLAWRGARRVRSYSLLLERGRSGWRVTRLAAQTLPAAYLRPRFQ